MKKLLLTLGSVAAVAAPIAGVVACGSGGGGDKTPASSSIDLTSVSDANTLVSKINDKMHFKMSRDAVSMSGSRLDEAKLNAIKTYMQGIDASNNVTLTFGNKSHTMDLSGVKSALDAVVSTINNHKTDILAIDMSSYLMSMASQKLPEIAAITGQTDLNGFVYSINMGGFLQISSVRPPTPALGADLTNFVANNEYFKLLREWHKVIWNLKNSELYTSWLSGKNNPYKLFKLSGTPIKKEKTLVAVGAKFDNVKYITSTPLPELHSNAAQTSNLEAVFGQTMLNIESLPTKS